MSDMTSAKVRISFTVPKENIFSFQMEIHILSYSVQTFFEPRKREAKAKFPHSQVTGKEKALNPASYSRGGRH